MVNEIDDQLKHVLTVPNSTKTAVPADATSAPSIHITNVIPTLPELRKMMLGAAKTLNIKSLALPHEW
jgi:hypothetical protein